MMKRVLLTCGVITLSQCTWASDCKNKGAEGPCLYNSKTHLGYCLTLE